MVENQLKQETLSQKLINKWFRAYIFVIFTAPLGYLIRLVASNTLSVSDVWIFYWVLSLVTLLYSYNDLWLTESMQYFLPKYRLENKKWQIKNTIWLSFLMQLITWIVIFCLLFFNAERLAVHHFNEMAAVWVIKVMSLYFLWYNLVQVCNSIFVAFQDTFNSGLMQFCNMCSVLIFSILFRIFASFDVSIFALCWIIWVAIWISVWLIQIRRKYKHLIKLPREKIDKNLISTQFRYAFRVFLTANVWTLLWNVDQQLVVNKLWSESSGYFTNMISLLNIFVVIVGPLITLLFPVATELSTRKEKEKFQMLESIMYTHFAFLWIMMWGIFLVFWQEISVLLYGEKFRFSWELLQILWPFLIFQCLSWLNFSLLAWLGKIRERLKILLVSLIVNVSCNVLALFVFNLDLHAVITVLALSRIVQFLWWLICIRKEYPFDFDRKFFFKNVLIIWILCLLFRWIKNNSELFYPNQNRWQLLFMLAWICLIYAWIIVWFNRWKIKALRNEVKKVRKSDS